jgi:hypothetical protein
MGAILAWRRNRPSGGAEQDLFSTRARFCGRLSATAYGQAIGTENSAMFALDAAVVVPVD